MSNLISFSKYLTEGGNVFKGETSPIKREWIEPTLEKYYQEMARIFPKMKQHFGKDFHPVGSVGKKPMSGDIDLAVDESVIFKKGTVKENCERWGLDEDKVNADAAKFEKAARTATKQQCVGRAILKGIAEKINKESKLITTQVEKTGSGNIFGMFPQFDDKGKQTKKYVQMDWMVGNLDWLLFSYFSDVYEGENNNVKGLHRTQFMLSMFQAKDYAFNHITGVKNKATGKVEANNSKEAIDLLNKLYKTKLTQEILNNYLKLREYIANNVKKEEYEKTLDIYLKILDSTRCDIPFDIQDYWIKNQKRLGLKGKFLPSDSKLIKYQTEKGE